MAPFALTLACASCGALENGSTAGAVATAWAEDERVQQSNVALAVHLEEYDQLVNGVAADPSRGALTVDQRKQRLREQIVANLRSRKLQLLEIVDRTPGEPTKPADDVRFEMWFSAALVEGVNDLFNVNIHMPETLKLVCEELRCPEVWASSGATEGGMLFEPNLFDEQGHPLYDEAQVGLVHPLLFSGAEHLWELMRKGIVRTFDLDQQILTFDDRVQMIGGEDVEADPVSAGENVLARVLFEFIEEHILEVEVAVFSGFIDVTVHVDDGSAISSVNRQIIFGAPVGDP